MTERTVLCYLVFVLGVSSVLSTDCTLNVCIRKCCKNGLSMTFTGQEITCTPSNLSHSYLNYNIPVLDGLFCNANQHAIPVSVNDTQWHSNGFITIPIYKGIGDMVPPKKYCFDHVEQEEIVFFCVDQEQVTEENRTHSLIGMIISMPFLLTTFLVYLLLPDKNVHQKALMLYVLSLLLAYVLLVAINLASNLSGGLCTSVGYLTLFFFMVSFFWMNVICFDIWYTFSGGRGYIGSRKNSENRRFLMYSAYAFGFPLLLLLVVFGMDKLPIDDRHKGKIGESKCFINDGWPQLWYLYLEAAILVIANILFFVLTALKIRQVKRETIMLKQSESKRHTFEKDKQRPKEHNFSRFNLFLKLLLAMGVNWSMEVISWLVNWITMDTVQYIWYLTDFVNAAYGVIIFFIFVFKKKIWRLLKKRYYNFIGKPNLARTVTTTETRTSHYSSTNYSNTDTHLTERTGVSGFNNGRRSEEIPLQKP